MGVTADSYEYFKGYRGKGIVVASCEFSFSCQLFTVKWWFAKLHESTGGGVYPWLWCRSRG